jgi:3-deoxy-D-manno-octulosonate 8-phosphate phosphatase (KDO 8-P phosphatase)
VLNDFKSHCIELIVYDFDGVMTDNRVLLQQDGKESVWVNRADGLGIEIIRKKGIPQIILSTETNPIVAARAGKVNLPFIQGIQDKRAALESYCSEHGYSPVGILYVGNDTNDMDVMKYVGMPVAPADAHPAILRIAVLILKTPGGHGVVRELADLLK